MKSLKRYARKEQAEEGFTLIELLVVVLILGILMAIAIPTFLSLTGGAKTTAAEADLTTASQDEAVYLTQNNTFDATPGADSSQWSSDNVTAMQSADSGINWTTNPVGKTTAGTKTVTVLVDPAYTGTDNTLLILGTLGSDGNQYWIQDNNGTLEYAETSSADGTQPSSGDFSSTVTSWKQVTVQPN